MDQSSGIGHFWSQADAVIHGVAFMLVAMSILSWTQIILKCFSISGRQGRAKSLERFWQAQTLTEAIAGLQKSEGLRPFSDLARQAANAAAHFDSHGGKSIGATERGEFLTRALRQGIVRSAARLESGLTLLASIGSIAPFVGLFGTVWGIYHALLSVAAAGSATIDKISGPVGEALLMTAGGLFVAIPAVLAYNAFTRLNRLTLAELDGFAHDLHAYLATGARLQPQTNPGMAGKMASS